MWLPHYWTVRIELAQVHGSYNLLIVLTSLLTPVFLIFIGSFLFPRCQFYQIARKDGIGKSMGREFYFW
jgi:hypothetical protein